MNLTGIFALLGQALAQAEQFIAGQAVTVTIPKEEISIDNVKVNISGSLSIQKG